MSFLYRFARRFVAGETLEAALNEVRRMNDAGLLVTLDFLGENTQTRDEAVEAANTAIRMLEEIDRLRLKANVSIKLTQMGLDISNEFCQEQVGRVAARAAELSNFIRIDMEGTPYTDRTIDVFEQVFRKHGNVGIVLQAYLRRTAEDVDRVNALKARVRLCKGAYKEPLSLAIKKMSEIRANYLKLLEKLLTHGTYPAVATHDEKLIAATQEMTRRLGIGTDSFEFQMLYGMRPGRQLDLVRDGYRMRVYVPFGTHWIPYFYRRLRERKENIFFVVTTFFRR